MICHTLEMDLHGCSIEALQFHAVTLTAVNRIESSCVKTLRIEEIHAEACFLIRREEDLDLTVSDFGMGDQIGDCSHYLCHTALVVATQKGIALGGDDGRSGILGKLTIRSGFNYKAVLQDQVSALVVVDHRLDAVAFHIICGIHMRTECDTGQIGSSCGHSGKQIPVLIQGNIGKPEFAELLLQQSQKIPFALE